MELVVYLVYSPTQHGKKNKKQLQPYKIEIFM